MLLDPLGAMTGYVGKSIHPEKRFFEHLACRDNNKGKINWILKLRELGTKPLLYILEETDVKHELVRESFWIDEAFKLGYQLLNIAEVYPRERLVPENRYLIAGKFASEKEYLEDAKKRRQESPVSFLKQQHKYVDNVESLEILASIRARHEKKRQEEITAYAKQRQAEIEDQAQTAKSWARQKKVLLLLCFGGIAWVAHFIYQAYLITNPF